MSKTLDEILADISNKDSLIEKFKRDTLEESIVAMAESYSNAERRITGTVKPPAADASDEEWGNFMLKIGAKASPESYPALENVAEEVVSKVRGLAADTQMTERQYEKMARAMQKEQELLNGQADRARQEIKSKYGDDFNEAKARAMRAAAALGEKGDIETDARLFGVLEKYGETMANDNQPLDTSGRDTGVSKKDASKAAAKAREIMESGKLERNADGYGQANREYAEAMSTVLAAGYESAFDPALMDEYDPYLRFVDPGRDEN